MNKLSRIIFFIFGLAVATDLFIGSRDLQGWRIVSKSLLMPLLAAAYYYDTRPLNAYSKLFLTALFFSWCGDVLLLFDRTGELFFMAGLVCFLTAHLLYIRYFLNIKSAQESYLRKRPLLYLAVVAYLAELLYVLWPTLGGMKIPVLLYGIIISTMLGVALWQYRRVSDHTAILFIAGAILFVVSDSLLALNKFREPISYAGIGIMLTYCLAQFFLARGSASHLREIQKS
jgi:uncharacterized membrane protein YhhN